MNVHCLLAVTMLLTPCVLHAQHPPHVDLGELGARQGLRVANLQELGAALALDLDGDGAGDLVLAAPLTHLAHTYAGSVYVLFGPQERLFALDPELAYPGRGLRIDGLESNDFLGRSIGPAGDLNADGFEDLALATDDRTWIVFGGSHLRAVSSIDLGSLGGSQGFELLTTVPGGNRQEFVPIGDVNADGADDLFIGRPERDDPWLQIPLRNDLRATASGDLDGDGDAELVVAEGDWDSIVVLENDGSGAFPTQTQLSLQENRALELVDLEGDGDLDLVAPWMKYISSSRQEGWVAVFPGLGDGSFGPRTDLQIGVVGEGVSVTVGDFDGDGDIDLGGINFQANHGTVTDPYTELRIYANDGPGGFTLTQSRVFTFHSREIVDLDVDDDGDRDLCVASDRILTPTPAVVRVYTNDGAGTFLPAGTLPLPGPALSFDVGDLTGDGREDLFASWVFFPNSPSGLQPGVPLTYPVSFTTDGELVDIDGNGTLDFIVEDATDGVQAHLNPGNGVFDQHFTHRYLGIRGLTRAGDLDGDGSADLIVKERSRVDIAFNRGGGVFGGALSGSACVLFGASGIGASGQLDLDALDGGNGFTVPPGPGGSSLGYAASAAGDFNLDGIDDFVFAAPFSDGDRGDLYLVYGVLGLGSTGVLRPAEIDPTSGITIHGNDPDAFCRTLLGRLDVDGDGRPDLVLGGPNAVVGGADAGRVRVLFGSPELVLAGTFDLAELDGVRGYTISGAAGMALGRALVKLGDWDRDGRDDFAAGAPGDDSLGQDKGAVCVFFGDRRPSNGQLFVSQLDGRRGFTLHAALTRSFLGAKLSTGDWNGDGRTDIYMPSPAYSTGAAEPGSVHFLWSLPHQLLGNL